MVHASSLVVLMFSLLGSPQATDPSQANILVELRGLRSSIEQVEKGQRMLVALARIQIDEGRLASLERQREPLAAQERTLSQEFDRMAVSIQREANGQSAVTGVVSDPAQRAGGVAGISPAQNQANEVGRRLDDTRRALQTLDNDIAGLRTRIAAWEQIFADLSR